MMCYDQCTCICWLAFAFWFYSLLSLNSMWSINRLNVNVSKDKILRITIKKHPPVNIVKAAHPTIRGHSIQQTDFEYAEISACNWNILLESFSLGGKQWKDTCLIIFDAYVLLHIFFQPCKHLLNRAVFPRIAYCNSGE